MSHIRKIAWFVVISPLLLANGCATHISLAPTVLTPPKPVTDGCEVEVAGQAEDLPDTIGQGTVTVFAIPVSPVHFSDPQAAAGLIMAEFRQTLQAAGYQSIVAPDPPQGVVLRCRITEMHFKNYTWFMPMVQTWGTIRLTLALTDPQGTVRWQKDYEGGYDGNGIDESFDNAVNLAMGKILARAAEDFTTRAFHEAGCGTAQP